MSRPYGRRPPYFRRDRKLVRVALLCVLGWVVAAGVSHLPLAHSTPANADQQAFEYWAHHGSSVCRALDRQPTVDGIASEGLDIINHTSLTVRQAGQVIGLAIHYTCPRHQHLIDEYAASVARA